MSLTKLISNAIFLSFVGGIPLWGALKKVPVYEAFVEGAKDGFDLIIKIIPHLVAMIVAIHLLRTSGLLNQIAILLAPVLHFFKMPTEILPLALIRPFSGAASIAFMADIIQNAGGNAYSAKLAAIIMGSTETTFYVIAVYFGSIAVVRSRHAILVGLLADLVGILAACFFAALFFG